MTGSGAKRRYGRLQAGVVALVVCAALLPGGGAVAVSPRAPSGLTDCSTWSFQPDSVADAALSDVAAMGKGRAVAVGFDGFYVYVLGMPRRERWTGTEWQKVAGPGDGTGERAHLLDIARIDGTGGAWAVGISGSGGRIERFAKGEFRLDREIAGAYLSGVDVARDRSTWAVGSRIGSGAAFPLALRYRDRKWRRVRVPSISGGSLDAVAVRQEDDAWAVGARPRGGSAGALVLRWNGTSWRSVAVPRAPDGVSAQYLKSVAVAGARRAVAVGYEVRAADSSFGPLLLEWDGSTWRRRKVPSEESAATLADVAATPDGVFYAVGEQKGPVKTSPLVIRKVGRSWRSMLLTSTASVGLSGVAPLSRIDVLAVGSPEIGPSTRVSARCLP
jgi:hypothetical protein